MNVTLEARAVTFGEALSTVKSKNSQIDARYYKSSGRYPIVDQSKKFIAGYTNAEVPPITPGSDGVIVFGDHTCVSKFVSFPFVVGADGTKILESRDPDSVMAEYISFILQLDPISPTGYNRHFGLLQERTFMIPPVEVQKSICEVLRDADDQIRTLNLLLDKKKSMKDAATQQLLNGLVRIPPHGEPWSEVRVSDSTHIKARIGWQGLTTQEYRKTGEFRLVGGTDFQNGRVSWETTAFVDKWRFEQDANIQLKVGDVLLTKDGTIGKVAFVDYLPGPTTLNSGVFVLRPKTDVLNSGFLYCLLKSHAFDEFVAGLSAGSTINHLYQKDLITLSFLAPKSVTEQQEIADVILAFEEEISVVEKQITTAVNVKLGIMQNLMGQHSIDSKEKE